MKKYLITGASGFVGRYLIDLLVDSNEDIKIITTTRNTKIDEEFSRFENFNVELTNYDAIYSLLNTHRPDYIIHLASDSSVGFSWKEPIKSFNNNVNIFLNIIEAVRILNINCRVLSIGSSEQYGKFSQDELPLQESHKLNPISPYAVARVSQELLSKVYVDGYGCDIVMTRSFNHTGPRQDSRFVIPSFARQLVERKLNNSSESIETGDLSIVRDFVDVRDVVKAYLLLLKHGRSGEVYNICSGKGQDLQTMFNLLKKYSGVSVDSIVNNNFIRPNDNPIIIGDNTKICLETGWKPEISIEDSLRDIINFWESKLSV